MDGNLDTTNVLLAVMAAVSVLEALLIIGMAIAGWKMYQRVVSLFVDLEVRHVVPTLTRVNRVLDDLQAVTSTVKGETVRVDHAINRTIERVDGTARRMRWNMVTKTSRLVGFVRGVRTAIESLLEDDKRGVAMKAGT